MNYFNYFTEIEDTFVRRRGKHLLLSPLDWALIESWKEINIPLHVALRGIEKAFDSWESKPRKRSVKSLLYCQEEVEAQYAEWVEAHLGNQNGAPTEGENVDALPFSRDAVLDHLQRARTALLVLKRERNQDELSEACGRAVALLTEVENDFTVSPVVDAQRLETSLTGLERMLSEALLRVVPATTLDELKNEAKTQLKPYRSHMEKSVYQQTFDNLLMKRLREHFAVPRLSLFYL